MARSVAIVGAGQIGYALACAFGEGGWDVTIHARTEPKWHERSRWRFEQYLAGESGAPCAEAIVDTIAFDAPDVARYDPDKVGRLTVISSASVYADCHGRTLDEAAQDGFPEFGGPICEQQSTVAPGPESYSTRKLRMENRALELFGDRATILRPCAIYGAWSRHPREWWFVKRMLDGRERIPLIHGGRSRFQTTNAKDIGAFALHAAEREIGGIFNIADDGCPTVKDIGAALAQFLDYTPRWVPIDGTGLIGRTPWSVEQPFMVSNAKMKATGFGSPSTYGTGARAAAQWLLDLAPTDWRAAFPQLAAYPWDLFDYHSEDAYLASH